MHTFEGGLSDVFNRKLPPNLLSLFHEHTANKRYNLRTQQDFQPKTVRTKQKQMCISCQGIDIWNSIDRNIKSCNLSLMPRQPV